MTTIIFNGQTIPSDHACIKHNDRGFTLGHGLFETILIQKGTVPAINYHWNRLETSAPLIGMRLPFSKQEFTGMLSALIHENNLQNKTAGARVTVTHGESARGLFPVTPRPNFVMSVFEHTPSLKTNFSALIATTRKNEHTIAARIKSISYLDNILAKQEAMSQGYDEAILLNTASNVADGAITNIFMVKNNRTYTPPIADGALPGVIRSILLEELKAEFPMMIEKSISANELLSADEVFVTNALMGIQPVHQINRTQYQVFSTGLAIAEKLREILIGWGTNTPSGRLD